MRLRKMLAAHISWMKFNPIKWTLTFLLMTGCISDSSNPQRDSVNNLKEQNKTQLETRSTQPSQEKQDNHNRPLVSQSKSKSQNDHQQTTSQKKVLINAPYIKQKPELPRGCEVTSLAMLLNHVGVSVDKMTLANKVAKVPFEENGVRGNLNDGFVGNMRTMEKPGIGVYHGPIKNLAEAYVPGKVLDFTGNNFNEVIAHLDQNRPVWVIVTSTYNVIPENEWQTWKTSSGPLKITYNMHSVLVTGYDQNYVYVNDPLHSKDRKLRKQPFIAGWEQMGNQAITVAK